MGERQLGGQPRPLGDGDPELIAGYRLVARLGAGGMGTVYLSYTPGGHPIALKAVRPELSEDPAFRRRFRQEVEAARRVQGLYTASVLDHDVEGERPWLATAYVAGPSLSAAVEGHGPLPVPSVLLLLAGMAEALSVIHNAGIVHRDLKPSNVLLAADGPRVIDFGIARATDATALTGTGVSIGTPAFMSPEQAEGKPVTPAADVFSLGQVAVFAATGAGAYGDGPSHAVLYRIVHEDPDLSALPPELAFIARCLAKDPAQRPSPAEIVTLCQQASPTPLRQSGSWLPPAISADITQRVSVTAKLGAPETPQSPPPTVPLTHLDQRPGPYAAPTVAAPHTPPPGAVPPPYGHPAPPPLPHYGYPQQPPVWQPPAPQAWRPPPPARNSGRKALGIIAAILLPLAGCTGLLYAVGKSTETSASSYEETETEETAEPLPDPTPVSYKAVDIPLDYYVNFEDDPPKPVGEDFAEARYGDSSDFFYVTGDEVNDVGGGAGKVVLLNNSQQGSLETCRTETRYTTTVSLDQLSEGSQMCVRSASGHIALVTFKGQADEDDPSDYVRVDMTIWHNAVDSADSY